MSPRNLRTFGAGLLIAATCSTLLAQPPEPAPTTTLWNFLGIPQAVNKIHGATFNRRGNHPRLEKKPPLKALADPANLKSDVPAIKAAAEIKQAEDLKQQKIKAIKYLATIGCGCYDKDEKVTKALLAAMEDCTEEVRLAAVEAISVAASGEYCVNCKTRSCCNEKITAQLYKIAYELDDLGCFVEPSERVRAAAIEALGICCPNALPIPTEEALPVEGATPQSPVEGATPPPSDVPPPPPVLDAARNTPSAAVDPNAFLRETSIALLHTPSRTAPALQQESRPMNDASWMNAVPMPNSVSVPGVSSATTGSSRRTTDTSPAFVPNRAGPVSEPSDSLLPTPPSSRRTARAKAASASFRGSATSAPAAAGVLQLINPQRNLAHVHFHADQEPVSVGTRLRAFSPTAGGQQLNGELEVIESFPGSATVRALGGLNVATLGRDTLIVR